MARKVAFITGASTGIGKELAMQLAERGYDMALIARRGALIEELSETIKQKGGNALAISCDVTDLEALKAAVAQCESQLGPIDLVLANAGVAGDLPVQKFDAQIARQIYEINVIGVMQTIAAALPSMLKRRKGHIVGISSLAAYTAFPRNYVYCASKAAVNAHLEGLRTELRSFGIRVTTICPGFIKTPLTEGVRFPMPLIMSVEDAVKIMVKAIESQKEVVNFPKALYWSIKLLQLMPRSIRSMLP